MIIDDVRRPLRFWSALDIFYAAIVAAVVIVFVPWKWPAAHALALAYCALHVVSAPGLWLCKRWAWRWAVAVSVVSLVLSLAVVGALIASWAYLKGVYGSFGVGASLVSLLMAATAWQVLGLYGALRLRALLRKPVRTHMRGGRAATVVVGAAVGLIAGGSIGLHNHHSIADAPSLDARTAVASLAWLRGRLQGTDEGQPPAGPANVTAWASLFVDGRLVARVSASSATWPETLEQLQTSLARTPNLPAALNGRLKLDVARGFAPVPHAAAALAIGFQPGRDGLRARGDNSHAVLPDDVIAADVYGTTPLLPFLEEVRLGVSPQWLRERLNVASDAALERFVVDAWIECGSDAQTRAGHICRVDRGVVDVPPLDSKQAALYAGQFMLRQQKPDGTFTYIYRPWQNDELAAGYNFARHAGTAYTLALLAPLAPEHDFKGGAVDALQWLAVQTAPLCGGQLCVREGNLAKVGNNALTLLALVTYQRNTGDARWSAVAHALAAWLISQQKPSGDLVPAYLIAEQRPATEMPGQMFASEEAAFALARAGRVLGEAAYTLASARAVRFLTEDKYSDFLGRFTYGADSWTCMAAAELPRSQVKPSWVDFCLGYADFLRRMQFARGEGDAAFVGHYGFTHVLVPQAPAAAGFAEALTATLQVAREHGRATARLEVEVKAALDALKRDQLRPGNDYLAVAPMQTWGGIRRSVVQSEIRIDFVQHAAAALAHGHVLGL